MSERKRACGRASGREREKEKDIELLFVAKKRKKVVCAKVADIEKK